MLLLFVCGAICFLIRSTLVFYKVAKRKQTHRIPAGIITYTDLNIPAEPLFSRRYRLTGKPDYIVKKNDQFIPVERKSGSSSVPQHSHLLQVAAYCQLLEDVTKGFVPYGILVYNDSQYTIRFDPGLRFELESTMVAMRNSLARNRISRNHDDSRRCRSCSMKKYCTKYLI